MTKYEIGKLFPFGEAPGVEVCRTSLNQAFFDITCYLVNPTPNDARSWGKGPIAYGLYVEQAVPFFIVDFGHWNFDVTINIHKVRENEVEDWLNSEGNIVNMYLVNAQTNILEAMRMISIVSSVSERLRDVLEEQLNSYTSHQAVDAKAAEIMQGTSTAQMMSRTKMVRI